MAVAEQAVRRRVRRLITVPVAVVATVGGMLVAATSAQASPPPQITSASSATFYAGAPNSFTVTGVGNACIYPNPDAIPATIKFDGQTQPNGICNGTAARTNGHPLPANITDNGGTAPGVYQFQIYAVQKSDFNNQVYQNFTLTVDPAATKDPKFTSADSTTFTAGTSGSFTVSTKVDAAHGKASLSDGGCAWPNGVTFTDNGDGTGTLAGTPGANSGGVYTCTLTATNAHGSTTQSFTLTVNQAPHLTGPASDTFTVGSSGSYTYKATGYPGVPTISISSGTLPAGVSLAAPVHTTNAHGDNVTTVNLQGTPAAGSGGVYNVQLVASNGTLPDATLNVTITVYEAPHFTSAPHATFIANRYNQFQVTAAGGYPPGPLTFTTTGPLPAGVSLSSSGLLSGTPPVSASGYHHFTITVSNGHASATQDFVLFIHAPRVPAAALVAPGQPVTALSATGECVTWHLSGYAPYAPVTVIAYPRLTTGVPYTLGTFTAGYNGRLTLNVCLPSTARGTYDLLAAGYATNGSIHYQGAWTIVQP